MALIHGLSLYLPCLLLLVTSTDSEFISERFANTYPTPEPENITLPDGSVASTLPPTPTKAYPTLNPLQDAIHGVLNMNLGRASMSKAVKIIFGLPFVYNVMGTNNTLAFANPYSVKGCCQGANIEDLLTRRRQ